MDEQGVSLPFRRHVDHVELERLQAVGGLYEIDPRGEELDQVVVHHQAHRGCQHEGGVLGHEGETSLLVPSRVDGDGRRRAPHQD